MTLSPLPRRLLLGETTETKPSCSSQDCTSTGTTVESFAAPGGVPGIGTDSALVTMTTRTESAWEDRLIVTVDPGGLWTWVGRLSDPHTSHSILGLTGHFEGTIADPRFAPPFRTWPTSSPLLPTELTTRPTNAKSSRSMAIDILAEVDVIH